MNDVRLKIEVVEMFSSMRTSGIFTMKCHLLKYLAENITKLGNISVLSAAVYDQLTFISGNDTKFIRGADQPVRRRQLC